MKRTFLILLVAFGLLIAARAATTAELGDGAPNLKPDAFEKRYEAKPGETQTEFTFALTNTGTAPIEIRSASTSCKCTAAIIPRSPWIIVPGASDTLRVVVDLRSRRGGLTKTVYLETNEGEELLLVHVQIPPPPAIQREMNLMQAQADRQAVLRGECASCHVTPTIGKRGAELFQTACGICHTAEHRATMVPDLMLPKVARDAAYWTHWIRNGGPGTLMPAFEKAQGGSLDAEQSASLVDYLLKHLPTAPVVMEEPEEKTP